MRPTREIKVDIGGRKYLITSDDDYLEHIKNGFESDIVHLFRSVASDSETILDIGANIGCTALLFADLAQQVHVFEPSETTYAFLQKNIAVAAKQNITSHNIGLGSESGESTLTFSPANRFGGFVSDQTTASVGHTVEKIVIKQLDEVVNQQNLKNIEFIKIDVEGFEGHVLRGAKETLAANKPVVVLELNHWCLNALQRTSVPDFLDQLRGIFPILLAVDGTNYLDLHNESDSYVVMYQHILHKRYPNLVAAFDESQVEQFRAQYQHGFVA